MWVARWFLWKQTPIWSWGYKMSTGHQRPRNAGQKEEWRQSQSAGQLDKSLASLAGQSAVSVAHLNDLMGPKQLGTCPAPLGHLVQAAQGRTSALWTALCNPGRPPGSWELRPSPEATAGLGSTGFAERNLSGVCISGSATSVHVCVQCTCL